MYTQHNSNLLNSMVDQCPISSHVGSWLKHTWGGGGGGGGGGLVGTCFVLIRIYFNSAHTLFKLLLPHQLKMTSFGSVVEDTTWGHGTILLTSLA